MPENKNLNLPSFIDGEKLYAEDINTIENAMQELADSYILRNYSGKDILGADCLNEIQDIIKYFSVNYEPLNFKDGEKLNANQLNTVVKALEAAIAHPSETPCLAKGMLVKTPSGFKKVEELKLGDQVYSYNIDRGQLEVATITNVFLRNDNDDVYNITLKNGNLIRVTSRHALYTNSGWRAYRAPYLDKILRVGDSCMSIDGTRYEISTIEADSTRQPIYHISVSKNSTLCITGDEKYPVIISEHYFKYNNAFIPSRQHSGGTN